MKIVFWPTRWAIAIVLVVGTGVISTALTFDYLQNYALSLENYSKPINLTGARTTYRPQGFVEAIEVVQDNVVPASGEVFAGSASGVYELGRGQASGFFVTSDGWLVTANNPSAVLTVGSTVVIHAGQVFSVQQIVQDKNLGLVFLKIAASNLPVISFGQPLTLSLGDNLFVVDSQQTIVATSFLRPEIIDSGSRSSETISRFLTLNQGIDQMGFGSVVADASGVIMGILVSGEKQTKLILSISAVRSEIFSLLKDGKIENYFFGAKVVNLQGAVGYSAAITRGRGYGELVDAVVVGSPAASAGLEKGDIILMVGDKNLDGPYLDELLLEYHPGDTVPIVIDRGGTEQTIEVVLGSAE